MEILFHSSVSSSKSD